MLDAYKRLEANGVIGKMMKVDARGHRIEGDAEGKVPGQLVMRPFEEFPKVVRRLKADGTTSEIIVGSKSEELRVLAESPDEFGGAPLSPLERERDALAQQVAASEKANTQLENQLAEAMKQIATLAQKIDAVTTSRIALGAGSAGADRVDTRTGTGVGALSAGKK
jgi:hypothetical protein